MGYLLSELGRFLVVSFLQQGTTAVLQVTYGQLGGAEIVVGQAGCVHAAAHNFVWFTCDCCAQSTLPVPPILASSAAGPSPVPAESNTCVGLVECRQHLLLNLLHFRLLICHALVALFPASKAK